MQSYMNFAAAPPGEDRTETLILLLDNSGSMESEDWPPSRLAGAIKASEALVDLKVRQYPHDRVGVVAFCGSAQTVHWPTGARTGAKDLKRSLSRLEADSATNITAGLETASQMLVGETNQSSNKGRLVGWLAELLFEPPPVERPADKLSAGRIVLLTDGEHNTGRSPKAAAGRLKAAGVTIDCIGIGGSPDEVDEKLLKAIASVGPNGQPRYAFIADKQDLIRKFQQLGNRLRPA